MLKLEQALVLKGNVVVLAHLFQVGQLGSEFLLSGPNLSVPSIGWTDAGC